MSTWSDLASSVRKLLVMQDQMDRLSADAMDMAHKLEEHHSRLIRIETIIDLARNQQVSRD